MKAFISAMALLVSMSSFAGSNFDNLDCKVSYSFGDDLRDVPLEKDSSVDYDLRTVSFKGITFKVGLVQKSVGPQAQFNYEKKSARLEFSSVQPFKKNAIYIMGPSAMIDGVVYIMTCSAI